eukprot:jgi/Undpi1/9562/HiC_scaffold_27.g12018.m1
MVARLSPTTRLFVLIGLAVVVHHRHHVAAQEEENNSIQTCADLIAAITEDTPTTTTTGTTTTTSFNLTSDITCSGYILIASGQNITIYGAAAANTNATTTTTTTITIATEFLANNASQSLLEVQEWGSLTLDGITFVREEEYVGSEEELQLLLPVEGIRAVHNMGTLTVNNCVFDGLNSLVENPLSQGGAIYTQSDGNEVLVSDSVFASNFATERGGAICAVGTDLLTVGNCEFRNNEASFEGAGTGGDIYANSGATLAVESSVFFGSRAGYGGAAIDCCGAEITDCAFVDAKTVSTDKHFGAVLVGRPGPTECPHELFLTASSFTNCTVLPSSGTGGSLAVFDTSATILDCRFEESRGTAVLFESSRPSGGPTISLTSSQFINNVEPAAAYARLGAAEGAALVVQNTGVIQEDEAVSMGELYDFFCSGHEPHKCEILFDLASIDVGGEAKCNVCSNPGSSTSYIAYRSRSPRSAEYAYDRNKVLSRVSIRRRRSNSSEDFAYGRAEALGDIAEKGANMENAIRGGRAARGAQSDGRAAGWGVYSFHEEL